MSSGTQARSLKERWADGESTLGAWCMMPGALGVESVGSLGFDWVLIDMQHGCMDFEGALEKYLALEEQIGMPPLGSTVSYFLLGQKDEYEKNMAYLKETLGEIHPYIAIVYVESDQLDLAFEMIDKLPQIDQSVLGYLPYLRKLRQHPRWQAVAERAGLWPDPRDEIKFEINVPEIYDQSKL